MTHKIYTEERTSFEQFLQKLVLSSIYYYVLRWFTDFRNLPLFDIDPNRSINNYQTESYRDKNFKNDLLNGHRISFKINTTESDTESKQAR